MNRIILITGKKNSGKTSFLKYFINTILRKRGLTPAGFIAEGKPNSGRKSEFELVNIHHHEKKRLCTGVPKKGWINMGKFYFDPEGLSFGDHLLNNIPGNANPVIIDEFGQLELSGKGWKKAVDTLMDGNDRTMIITVRKDVLAAVVVYFNGNEVHVFNIDMNNRESLAAEITKLLPG